MLNILVATDNKGIQEQTAGILKPLGQCTIAINGKLMIKKYKEMYYSNQPFDLVLLDSDLALLDGIECIHTLRFFERELNLDQNDRVKIIIMMSGLHRFTEATQAGCNEFLLKPIDADNLINKVRKEMGLKLKSLNKDSLVNSNY